MTTFFKSRWLKLLAMLVGALTAVWAVGAAWDMYKVMKMTETMKTVCVGRMLIDLPQEANVELLDTWIEGFDIDAYPEGPEAFAKRVAARDAEIRAKPDRLGGNKNMEEAREVKTENGLTGYAFVHGRYVTEGESYDGLTVDHYRYEGVALEAHVHGEGISIDLMAKKYDPKRMGNLLKLISQLVPNPGNRVPTAPGFCFDYAYVRDPLTADQGERVALFAHLPSHPDIEIHFDSMAGIKPDGRGLLARNAASHARLSQAISERFTNLRAAPRTIGGLTGDELVERVVEENFVIINGFEWDVGGKEGDVYVPALNLTMATGRGREGPVSSSLSEVAALALWDRIASSIRVRPTATSQVNIVEPQTPPLGAYASAGNPCPAGGWWECSDGGAGGGVAGGRRQYFRQGVRLPQALLLPRQTLWGKIRGRQPSYENTAPTLWKLVDKRGRKRVAPVVALAQAGKGELVRVHDAAGQPASVGTQAVSGMVCPVNGWWCCQEERALDGTRWFAQGSVLPPATIAVPAGGSRIGADSPGVIQRRVAWQLARLAPTVNETNEGSMPGTDVPDGGRT